MILIAHIRSLVGATRRGIRASGRNSIPKRTWGPALAGPWAAWRRPPRTGRGTTAARAVS